ncbi:DUF2252 domain-containing protein [Aquabacterium sp. A7-Y]|uniref:DUF2252 domain-containing protein n=1 Tax=Aquabacterium sp. A7-Y TaxID=1349605 RepID=UPI00223E0901|nr:DUF2252 domain-containing protein [Aquabacterium sp. A7-Y]MCW7541551.1 DUF2252 domain-containing protein [Aquabacterium sp. A7-Y]
MKHTTDHLIGRGSLQQRREQGRAARKQCPRSALGRHEAGGRDALALLAQADPGRVAELLPLRYGRMLASPFAFFRGAAGVMAHDLARGPRCPIEQQICGDAHLGNFGLFASPERRLLFGLNDFDETLPGPFDWDLRRLAASAVVAARERGCRRDQAEDIVRTLLDTYHERILAFAEMDTLDVWYTQDTAESLLRLGGVNRHEREAIDKARRKGSRQLVKEAVDWVPGPAGPEMRIKDEPPWVYHHAGATEREISAFEQGIEKFLMQYRGSLAEDRRVLFDRYELMDVAVRVPGVGSVGRRCFVALFAADGHHPLFLQIKEARESALAPWLGAPAQPHNGRRIVFGQRLCQAASDIFLGWASSKALGAEFYVRQLRDMKGRLDLEDFDAGDLGEYAAACGYALARSQAKAGDPARIAGYIGKGQAFDDAVVAYALAYADQTEADHAALVAAVRAGRIEAMTEEGG